MQVKKDHTLGDYRVVLKTSLAKQHKPLWACEEITFRNSQDLELQRDFWVIIITKEKKIIL